MSYFDKVQLKLFPASCYEPAVSFDLQLFASPEDEGRTEEPTEKRIRDAREKGQVAKSQELGQTLVVISSIMIIFAFGGWILESLAEITKYFLSSFSTYRVTERRVITDFYFILYESGKVVLPVFAISVFAAVAGNLMQVGFMFTTHPLKVNWSKLKFDPATIMKKVLFSKQVGMNLVKSLFKVGAIGFVAYLVIMGDIDDILKTPDLSIGAALHIVLMSGFKIIVWTSVLLLIMSVPDYFFQKKELMESLKMTKQQLKEEYKESQGDPHVRARLREMQRNIVMKNMIREVPKADVVVTNPTHYAVALKYDSSTMEAPTVIAKGVDSMALRIRQTANENGVVMIENRPLAQRLYKDVEVGDIIPVELFQAVTLVYAELYKRREAKRAI